MEDLTPLYNKEFYLAYLCGEDVVLPIPDGNAERYLAYLCGMDVTIPNVPDGRTETYLAYKCGEDVVLPDPMYRIEYYLAKWCGIDCEVPEPLYRIEYWLAQLANSGELKTVTGNPISVSDALAKPAESLTIEILPQQDLHGYANPWPAGGGVNLLNPSYRSNLTQNIRFYYGTGILLKANTAYTFSVSSTSAQNAIYEIGGGNLSTNYGKNSLTYTPTNDVNVWIDVYYAGNYPVPSGGIASVDCQLELGSTATTYAPYSNICPISGWSNVNVYREAQYDAGATPYATINLNGTVYGGSLDVTSGELVVDRAMVDLGTLEWLYNSNWGGAGAFYCRVAPNGIKTINPPDKLPNAACSEYALYTRDNLYATPDATGFCVLNNTAQISVRDSAYSDAASFREAMSGVQLVYELATPQTIQLTPTEIEMLLGNNVIWNDVGDMVLEYLADGPADDIDALNILLNNRYVNNGEPDEATDKEALEILLGGNTR